MSIIQPGRNRETPADVAKKDTSKVLRGKRINEIRQDLANKDLEYKDKALIYSGHLNWFIDKVGDIIRVMEAMRKSGTWEHTPYQHGMMNGVIMALGILMEDEKPPFAKRPKKYKQMEPDTFQMQATAYIEKMESLIDCCLRADHKGPNGYRQYSRPWDKWREDILETFDSCFMESNEQALRRERIKEHIENQP